ncbi:MAG: hypothetical protein JW800_06955 [Candidatus Omnitrophica bacterium]|nr:hypothetical protein [Candidatus Omnitrophota bacterium]
MSIITDALKKAERQKKYSENGSDEYINKIAGPPRDGIYRKELNSALLVDSGDGSRKGAPKILVSSTVLLTLAIVGLFLVNLFVFGPAEMGTVAPTVAPIESNYEKPPLEAEAYTDMKSEIALIERKDSMAKAEPQKTGILRKAGESDFVLNGIAFDEDDRWALINNEIVRVGEFAKGAKVVSIAPKEVTLVTSEGKKLVLAAE